jgi:transcriptional regulator with XRE-family HTH domain
MSDDLSAALAAALLDARRAQGLSAGALAERSGVSRAMIGKVERGEAQPTAVLLSRLAGALGITLSALMARAEGDGRRLLRAADQPVWTDPATGYRRRAVSPPTGGPLELVEVSLPAGTELAYPADASTFVHQQLWMLEGRLRLSEGDAEHELGPGDCLAFGPPAPTAFRVPADAPCRYLVALTKRAG